MAFFQGDDALLQKIYNEAINRKKKLSQSKMGAHLETDLLPLQKDMELYEMIDMIIRKNLPLGVTEDPDFRYATQTS